jgi:hypothetical protein
MRARPSSSRMTTIQAVPLLRIRDLFLCITIDKPVCCRYFSPNNITVALGTLSSPKEEGIFFGLVQGWMTDNTRQNSCPRSFLTVHDTAFSEPSQPPVRLALQNKAARVSGERKPVLGCSWAKRTKAQGDMCVVDAATEAVVQAKPCWHYTTHGASLRSPNSPICVTPNHSPL